MLPFGLGEERDLDFKVVLEGGRFQGFVKGSGRRENHFLGNHVGINDTRIEQIRTWWRLESFVHGDKVGVEAVGVEHPLLGCAQDPIAKLLDLVTTDVQTLPVREQLEGRESVNVVQRGFGQLTQRLQHLVDDMEVLALAQLILHHEIRVAAHNHCVVDVDHIVAALWLPGDVQRWVAAHVGGDLVV